MIFRNDLGVYQTPDPELKRTSVSEEEPRVSAERDSGLIPRDMSPEQLRQGADLWAKGTMAAVLTLFGLIGIIIAGKSLGMSEGTPSLLALLLALAFWLYVWRFCKALLPARKPGSTNWDPRTTQAAKDRAESGYD